MDERMEGSRMILLDSSVLIDYFRKTHKKNAFLWELMGGNDILAISVITKYEIYVGSSPAQKPFWDTLFETLTVYPIDDDVADIAVVVQQKMKQIRLKIDVPDLLIASTALSHNCALATLNIKHFESVPNLILIAPGQ